MTHESWRVTALDTGTSVVDASVTTYLSGFGEEIEIPHVMWLIEGDATVVVDASAPDDDRLLDYLKAVDLGAAFRRSDGQVPANALEVAGIDPTRVELLILTHLHWDHTGCCSLFPRARVLVQETELRTALVPSRYHLKHFLSPLSSWPGQTPYLVPGLETIDNERELLPGITVIPTPGHTAGSMSVLVDTPHGRLAIAGDAVMSYDNYELGVPPGFHVDVDKSLDSMALLRERADFVLPGHDYRVFSREGRSAGITAVEARAMPAGDRQEPLHVSASHDDSAGRP